MKFYSSWSDIPETMCTATELKRRGLKPAKGQKPVARKVGGYGPYDLYLIADAVPKRKASPAQIAALEKARSTIGTSVCSECGARYYRDEGDKKGLCDNCYAEYQYNMIEADRAIAKAQARAWAQRILEDGYNILDTETTGLDGTDEIVQLALIGIDGRVIVDTLVKPSYIPGHYAQAQAIHGIAPEQLQDAPTMVQVWPLIQPHLDKVVIYNADFDTRLISQSLAAVGIDIEPIQAECAMQVYSAWIGEWHDYYKNFRWQRLPGGDHTALGDALATLAVIQQMAGSTP